MPEPKTSRSRRFVGSGAVPFREIAARLSAEGELDAVRAAARRFPARLTEHYAGLIDPEDPDDPIRRIAFPDPRELRAAPTDLEDPVGERDRSPVPYVVRKHADRLVWLVASRCHVYCRFCFRRTFPDGDHREPTASDFERALDYVEEEAELREVILSGGDPLTLDDDTLRSLVERLARVPHLERVRVHTRAPVHDPARVTPSLAAALDGPLPTRVVTHFDHPREVTEASRRAVRTLLERGIPVLNQSVLLVGVNDDADTLAALCRALLDAQVEPYYLHHPDRVPGAGSFHLALEEGWAIYRELRERLGGGPGVPEYVVDPPDGSGKVPVEGLVGR